MGRQMEHTIVQIQSVYKEQSRESENMPFISSCPFYTGSNYMHYLLNGENEIYLYRP